MFSSELIGCLRKGHCLSTPFSTYNFLLYSKDFKVSVWLFFCHAILAINFIFFHAVWCACIYYVCIFRYDTNEASSVARMFSSWNIWSSGESLMFIQLKLELFRNISGLRYRNHTSFMLINECLLLL